MDNFVSTDDCHNNMSIITGEIKGKSGRPAVQNRFEERDTYIECIISSKGKDVCFLIDKYDLEKVKTRHWYGVTSCNYIGSSINIEGKRKILYLHNFIMNKLTFEGRGQKETVDHINRNGLDNRKCNLRIVSQTMQNINQNKKKRRVILPTEYNISHSDLPKHVTYVKARGNHGDGFCVEFKKDGKKIYNPYIRSKVLTIEEKLEKIKVLLQRGYELYPEFNPEYENESRNSLESEFQSIINEASQSTPASVFLNTK